MSQKPIYEVEKCCIISTRWMERPRIKVDMQRVKELIQSGQQEIMKSLDSLYTEISNSIGRNITPFYFYLLKEGVAKYNPELEATEDPNKMFRNLIIRYRKEAEVLEKKYRKDDLQALRRIRSNPLYKELLERVAPPNRGGVELRAEYDIMSTEQLGVLLYDLGVEGLKLTETDKFKTDSDALTEILDKSTKYPFLKKVKWFRENLTAVSKLDNLFKDADREDDSISIRFKTLGTNTGRFATPGSDSEEEDFAYEGGTKFNLQGIPATYDQDRPPALLRVRECVVARDNKLLAAIDFSGVELRIVTNLSFEPKWIQEFFQCSKCKTSFDRGDKSITPPAPPHFCPNCGSDKIGDIHTLTALQIYGQDAIKDPNWKHLRSNGKSTNFALSYGGSGKAVVRSTGCDENEGYRIKKQFDNSFLTLKSWWDRQHLLAREKGYVYTAFHRKYPTPEIKEFWELKRERKDIPDELKFRANKEARNSVNSPVQGTSADITKLGMIKIYKECKTRSWLDKVHMLITMHDELVFEIDVDIFEEAIDLFSEMMTRSKPILDRRWQVPLTSDTEVGPNWSVPYNVVEIRHQVDVRRKLQNPSLSREERTKLIGILLECVGKEKLRKKGSLEQIKWPDILAPHFKGGVEELTQVEKDTLKEVWAMIFEEGAPEVVTKEVKKEESVFVYTLTDLSVETALKLAEGLKQKGSDSVQIVYEGKVLSSLLGYTVNKEEFLRCLTK
jgi:DNA polymerase I-like protein with 3'-5' exonuclease and polymerase domains